MKAINNKNTQSDVYKLEDELTNYKMLYLVSRKPEYKKKIDEIKNKLKEIRGTE